MSWPKKQPTGNEYFPPVAIVPTHECFRCDAPRSQGGGLYYERYNIWQCNDCLAEIPAAFAQQNPRKPEVVR